MVAASQKNWHSLTIAFVGRVLRRSAILIVGGAAAGCTRDLPTAPPPEKASNTAAPTARGGMVDLTTLERFRVSLNASGSMKPGESITLQFAVQGLIDTRDAEIRLSMPEYEASKSANSSAAYHVPVNTPLPALLSEHVSLPAGASIQRTMSVRVPYRGYYRVVVSVFKRSDEPTLVKGHYVPEATHRTLWLFVAPSKGRVTPDFDQSIIPDGMMLQPGPLRELHKPSAVRQDGTKFGKSPSSTRVMSDLAPSGCQSYNVVCGNIVYYNQDDNAYEGVMYALLTGDEQDREYGTDMGRYTTETWDASGYFEQNCSAGPATYWDAEIDAVNFGSVTVLPQTLANISPYVGDNCDWDMGQIVVNSTIARVFVNMNAAIDASRSLFNFSASELYVQLYDGGPNGASYYSTGDHNIHLNDNSAANQVWTTFGVFTTAHEYGHAVMNAMYNGLPPSNCPNPHFISQPEDRTCAWSEGWADYHAAATRGTAIGSLYDALEGNSFESVNEDGTQVEGVVAAFLLDITDPANESPYDVIQYPGSYLFNLVKTCRVNSYYVPSTVDQTVYCLEDNVDHSAQSTYFPYSSVLVESNSATKPADWNASNIRTLWKWDLFRVYP